MSFAKRASGAALAAALVLGLGASVALANNASPLCEGGHCPANPTPAQVQLGRSLQKNMGSAETDLAALDRQRKDKRASLYMTATSEDGGVYSYDYGPVAVSRRVQAGMALVFILACLMLYGLVNFPLAKPESENAPEGEAPPSSPLQPEEPVPAPLPPALAPSSIKPTLHAQQDASWADLVRACQGDAVRAGTILAGEVAASPNLTADSPIAIARALSRLAPS